MRGSWGKSWINRSRPQVPARGTPTEERTWLLWEDGVQETYRNALSLETSLAKAQSSRWRVEAVAETAETGRPLVCLILSVNILNAICTINKRSCEPLSDLQE